MISRIHHRKYFNFTTIRI